MIFDLHRETNIVTLRPETEQEASILTKLNKYLEEHSGLDKIGKNYELERTGLMSHNGEIESISYKIK